jgi:23S rRNA pseudouridine2605 synthase
MNDQPSGRAGPPRKAKPPSAKAHPGERIAKVMARAGLCSRRDAEGWIAAGRVTLNGQVLASPAVNVTERDEIKVDGAPLVQRERTRLFLFHKPRGLVTTARDPEGRSTIFDALPEDAPRLVAVGRLDINTEGLMLLTNDGGLARVLELPATGWLRRYRVRAHGAIDQAALDNLVGGVTIDGVSYAGIEAKLDRSQGANVWLTMGLREGKNREIKRVLEHLGLAVNRLIRISFGPFQLGEIEEGALIEAPTRVVREQIGPRLAREAGADFDAPIREKPRPEGRERRERNAKRFEKGPDSHRDDRARRFSPRNGAAERDLSPARDHHSPDRKRKYFAAIRAEREEDQRGPRRRIERGATSDRKGRSVEVERVQATGDDKRHAEAPRRGPKRAGGDKSKPRDRSSFGDKRKDSAGAASHRRGGGPRSPHRPRRG